MPSRQVIFSYCGQASFAGTTMPRKRSASRAQLSKLLISAFMRHQRRSNGSGINTSQPLVEMAWLSRLGRQRRVAAAVSNDALT